LAGGPETEEGEGPDPPNGHNLRKGGRGIRLFPEKRKTNEKKGELAFSKKGGKKEGETGWP